MIELISIILIFLFSYILILKRFELSIYVLIILSVLLHKELFSFYTWDLMPIRSFMLAFTAASLTKLYFVYIRKNKLLEFVEYIKQPFVLSLILLWIIRGLSIIFSKNIKSSILLYGFFTTVVVMCIHLYISFKNKPDLVFKYIRFFIFTVFGLSLFGYFQFFLYQTTGNLVGAIWNIPGNLPRIGSLFWDVNHYGALLSSLAPILGVLIITQKSWKSKLLYLIMFITILGSIFLTNSRTSWIMAFVSFIVFVALFLYKKVGKKGIFYVLASLVLISIPLLFMYSQKGSVFRTNVKQYFHYRIDSFDSHIMLLTGTYQIFEMYPYLGGGYGSFFEHFSKTKISPVFFGRDPAAFNTRVPAHTIWGEVLSETGILGMFSFIFFVGVLFSVILYSAFNSKDTKNFLITISMFSSLVGWFVAGIFYSYNSEFFWIILVLYFLYSLGNLSDGFKFSDIVSKYFTSDVFLKSSILIILLLIIFSGLGKNYLIPWDEAIYSKISKNMIVNNEYMHMTWEDNKTWYEKPPLYMWMMVPFMRILGFTSLAARLPSALLGFLIVFLVYGFAKRLFGKSTAFISSLSLLTTIHFVYYSRAAMTDVSTTFFITLSVILYYYAKLKDKLYLYVLSGIFLGLGVMTKGVVGFLPLGIMGIYEVYLLFSKQSKLSFKLISKYLILILTSAVIFMPWHIISYIKFGDSFINNYLGYHVIERATTSIEEKGRPWYWYFIVMKVSMRIWFVSLLGAFPFFLFLSYKKNNKAVFLTIWSLFTLLFFSLANSKLVWYILPIYPPLAIICGYFINSFIYMFLCKVTKLGDIFHINFNVNFVSAKSFIIYLLTIFSLFYFFMHRNMVYTTDTLKSPVDLIILKEQVLGIEDTLYIDKLELPVALFYSNGPFKVLDFNPTREEKIPQVSYFDPLILLTKKGRYSEYVVGRSQKPSIIKEDGDWILWYFDSEYEIDSERLDELNTILQDPNSRIMGNYLNLINEVTVIQDRIDYYSNLRIGE